MSRRPSKHLPGTFGSREAQRSPFLPLVTMWPPAPPASNELVDVAVQTLSSTPSGMKGGDAISNCQEGEKKTHSPVLSEQKALRGHQEPWTVRAFGDGGWVPEKVLTRARWGLRGRRGFRWNPGGIGWAFLAWRGHSPGCGNLGSSFSICPL